MNSGFKNRLKVAITGAAGQIGYSLLPRIASGEIFGKDTKVDLHLIELDQALQATEGVVMELLDCAFPSLGDINITSSYNSGFDGANYVCLIGSVPRKAGMERADLLKINGPLFVDQGRAINDFAARDAKTLVVGNPCNTNAYIAMRSAPDRNSRDFFALTRLDELRAISALATKLNVSVEDIEGLSIWGNHSATMYPNVNNCLINGEKVTDLVSGKYLHEEFTKHVQQRGAQIIKARGLSSAASAAHATLDTLSILNSTPILGSNNYLSIALESRGEYEIEPGLMFSYPCVVSDNTVSVIEGIELDDYDKAQISITEDELRSEKLVVDSLLSGAVV